MLPIHVFNVNRIIWQKGCPYYIHVHIDFWIWPKPSMKYLGNMLLNDILCMYLLTALAEIYTYMHVHVQT